MLGTTEVEIQNFIRDKIVKVTFKKNSADAFILAQIIELDMRRAGSSDGWTHVKFAVEVSSGTPNEKLPRKSHGGHVIKVDHGGGEILVVTDSGTVPDNN